MKMIERRLAAAERILNPPPDRIAELIIHGGLPHLPDGPMFASAGTHKWKRESDESFAVFRARATADAEAKGEAWIVYGGLPKD